MKKKKILLNQRRSTWNSACEIKSMNSGNILLKCASLVALTSKSCRACIWRAYLVGFWWIYLFSALKWSGALKRGREEEAVFIIGNVQNCQVVWHIHYCWTGQVVWNIKRYKVDFQKCSRGRCMVSCSQGNLGEILENGREKLFRLSVWFLVWKFHKKLFSILDSRMKIT